ncbi:MAG: pantetheine-phosphate adenylyltransferase [Bacteroidota bacterium]
MKKAIYGFSGDPITYGHIDIIKRALDIFGELIVGIGMNPAKKYFFSLEERRQIAAKSLQNLPNVSVIAFKGLLVDYAYENGISTVIRGIRNSEDLNYEMMLHQVGASQRQQVDTIYFPARQSLMHISSGAAKALQLEQGLIHEYVPLCAKQKLEERLSGQYIVGVTGEIGVGKSYISQQLQALGQAQDIPVHVIDIDKIGHQILGKLEESIYKETRQEIANIFGSELLTAERFIDRSALGKIIFQSSEKLRQFNEMLYKPLLLRLRRELYGKKGVILLDSALISETGMSYLSNNHVILVSTQPEIQKRRIIERGYNDWQIQNRMNSQFTHALKEEMILESIKKTCHGKVWKVDNSSSGDLLHIHQLFRQVTTDLGLGSKTD